MLIVVFDIDGTLADNTHRQYLIDTPDVEPDWDAYDDPAMVEKDTPYPDANETVWSLIENADDYYFVTGRQEKLRAITEDWLDEHYGLHADEDNMFMRMDDDDVSTNAELKEDIFSSLIELYPSGMRFIFFDDNPDALDMYSERGIAVQAPECWALLR